MDYDSSFPVINNSFKVGAMYSFFKNNICHLIGVCTFSHRQYANFESKEIPESSDFYRHFTVGHSFKFKDPSRYFTITRIIPISPYKKTTKKTKTKKRASK